MEAINVTDNRMYSLIYLYDLHTKFLAKAIDGISDEDAHNRLGTKANHVAWLVGTLVEQRFDLSKGYGINEEHAAHELFKDHKGIQENVKYPPLTEFQKDWDKISPLLRAKLEKADKEKLDKMIDMGGEQMSTYDLAVFIIYREANCIGQIALYRRLLGYEAMKYM